LIGGRNVFWAAAWGTYINAKTHTVATPNASVILQNQGFRMFVLLYM
jgi:hypothetical protein